MSAWEWALVAAGIALAVYVVFVGFLFFAGRSAAARAVARFVPDCVVLFRRLLRDPRVPRRRKLLLVLLVGYLASPIDLVPDVIPVVGFLDDGVVVALVLRYVLRRSAPELITDHWPGPPESRDVVLRLAGHPPVG